jgi:glycosyltransferase involved in cell wall biosynthesis
MPRVLRIINRLNLGGPTHNAAYLSKFLGSGFETMLISGMKELTEESSEFIVENLDLHPLYIPEMHRSLHPFNDYKAYHTLKKIIQKYKPDIVHTHASKAGAIGRLAAWNCSVPVIIHTFHGHVFHSYFNRSTTDLFVGIERYLANRTTKIIALSALQKNELCNIYKIAPSEKFQIIPLGLDLLKFQTNQELKREKFRNDYNIDDDEIAIGIIGRLVAIKNHALFLKAIKTASEKTKKRIRAYIIGDGEERVQVEETARSLGLQFNNSNVKEKNIITFTGWIKEIDKCYAGMDIIALTSDNEGTPVSLIEAQAAGRAILTTDVGGVLDIVIENETALIVDKNNAIMFAEMLFKVIDNDDLRFHLSQKGPEFALSRFSYQRLCKDMAGLYNSSLNESRNK